MYMYVSCTDIDGPKTKASHVFLKMNFNLPATCSRFQSHAFLTLSPAQ